MGLHKWSFLWSLVVCQAMSISAAELTVGINASSCEHKNDVLFCDYKNSNQDTVKMNPISDDTLKKVFLYNINKLILSESVCVSVALHNVKDVVINEVANAKCNNTVELSAKKCKLDRIPKQMTALYLEESELNSLETDAAFSKLSVISSNINTLKLTNSLAKETKAVIQDSRVTTLHKMVIDNGASLLIMKSTINTVKEKGLEIIKGDVTVKDSTFIAAKGSVDIDAGGSLTVGSQQGDMTVTGRSYIEQPPNTDHSGSYLVPFVIFLILFLISLIVIALMAYYCKDALMELRQRVVKKSTQDKPKNDEENLLLDNNRVCQHAEKAQKHIAKIKEEAKSLKDNYRKREKAFIIQIEDLKKELDNQTVDISTDTGKQKSKDKQKEDNSKILEQINRKIAHLHKKLACTCTFLGNLEEKEVAVIDSLTQDFFNLTGNDTKKMVTSITTWNCSEEVAKNYEKRFEHHEKELQTILDLLTSPHKKDAYKTQFNLSDEMIKNFKELSDKLEKDKSKKNNAISYCAKKIEEIELRFKANLLDDIDEELRKRMERTEKLFEYLTENSALQGKDQQDPPQIQQTEASTIDENEISTQHSPAKKETTAQELNQVHTEYKGALDDSREKQNVDATSSRLTPS